jgi:transcriptional regulator with XRE-family HTH domain
MSSAPIRSEDELSRAAKGQVRKQIRYELSRVLDQYGLSQEQLAHRLGYNDGASISKWLGGHSRLSKNGAKRLDDEGFETSLGVSFTSLLALSVAKSSDPRRDDSLRPDFPEADVFLASPMAALGTAADYDTVRKSALELCTVLENYCQFSVYYGGRDLPSDDEFEAPDFAAETNFRVLEACRYFVLMTTEGVHTRPSSVWVEAGYALALQKPSLYLVTDPSMLPYALRAINQHQVPELLPPVSIEYVASAAKAIALVRQQGPSIFSRLDEDLSSRRARAAY